MKNERIFKNVLKGIRSQEIITDLTVITGTTIRFSGKIECFMKDVDIDMMQYRNGLLNSPVIATDKIGTHLFVFLYYGEKEKE